MAEATAKRRRWWLMTALLSVPVAFIIGFSILQSGSGVRVTVRNSGPTQMGSVVLHITGKSYFLGDVAAGSSVHATVNPASESHLEIEFTDGAGKSKRVNAGGYFEAGYRGTIRVSIKDGAVDENEQNITVY